MQGRSLTEFLESSPLTRFHYTLLGIGSLVYCLTAMNTMLIAAVMLPISKEWSLDPVTIGFLFSSGYVGMFIGAITCGVLADLIGRKKTLLIVVTVMSLFTASCSVAWDVISMAFLRFLAGIGLGGTLPQPGIYVSEYVPARHRGKFIGFIETCWVYGALLSLLFPYFFIRVYGWRLTFLIALIPLLLIPFILAYVPESIRYLERRGRINQALNILRKYGIVPSDVEVSHVSVGQRRISIGEMLSQTYLKRTVLLWILWAVLVYTYHGIFLWLPTIYAKEFGLGDVKSLWWTLVVTLFQIPGYYLATFLLDPVGRKPVLISFLSLAGTGCLFLSLGVELNWILLWSCVISFFNLGSWAALYTYTPELYPTRMRGAGSGIAASVGRLAGILAPTVTGHLYKTVGLFGPFMVFAFAHLLAALSVLILGVETRRRRLEEISR